MSDRVQTASSGLLGALHLAAQEAAGARLESYHCTLKKLDTGDASVVASMRITGKYDHVVMFLRTDGEQRITDLSGRSDQQGSIPLRTTETKTGLKVEANVIPESTFTVTYRVAANDNVLWRFPILVPNALPAERSLPVTLELSLPEQEQFYGDVFPVFHPQKQGTWQSRLPSVPSVVIAHSKQVRDTRWRDRFVSAPVAIDLGMLVLAIFLILGYRIRVWRNRPGVK